MQVNMSNTAASPSNVEDVQGDGRWESQHKNSVENCILKKPKVLFVGDSLIQYMEDTEIWEKSILPLNPVNAGVSEDCTQHVLWRLQNGLLSSCQPKVVVILVGTNNYANSSDEIVEALEAIGWCINNNVPSSKTIILGVLPRGKKPNSLREKIYRINYGIESIVGTIPNTYFLDADPGFVRPDGSIAVEDMADFLHLTRRGYLKFCGVVAGFIRKLLSE